MIPSPWEFALLALAAYRIWQLAANDTILDRPRDWLLDRVEADEWLTCPWCAGFWIVALWWVAWLVFPYATLVVAVLWALSCVVGIMGHYLTR